MSLLAEEVVEEWLNRSGFFTIRGARVGNDEMDILAIRPLPQGGHECRHVEVQASTNPISYITKVPAAIREQTGISAHNAKRRDTAQLTQGVREWIEAKFDHPRKAQLRESLCSGPWTRELVVGVVRHEKEEIPLIIKAGVVVHRLKDIILQITGAPCIVKGAGADLCELMRLAR